MSYKKIRKQALERDSYTCQNCGSDKDLHVHHVTPRWDGGGNELQNLMTLCRNCHEKLHQEAMEALKAECRRNNTRSDLLI